ncbi:MAG: hypothetical protein R3B84_01330 [Zavarzinella sp.]
MMKNNRISLLQLSVRPREAAAMLGISQRKLFELTKQSKIRRVKLPGGKNSTSLYLVEDLRKFLETNMTPMTEEAK